MLSITTTIIILTVIISLTAFSNDKIKNDLLFWPFEIDERKQYFRFLSYGFVHADFMHLLFNMYALNSFGEAVERYLYSDPALFGSQGKWFFLLMYVTALIVSVIPDYFYHKNHSYYRALGASGAVSAVIFSYMVLQPNQKIGIIFLPPSLSLPAYIMGILFIGISIFLARRGSDNIGHRAHVSGALYGFLFTILAAQFFSEYNVWKNFIAAILPG
jgi:membrane associated rhomboid family serine protease